MKVIRIFNAQPVKIPHFNTLLTRKKAWWPHFLLHFFNVHIMNVNYVKFQKMFDSSTISRELPSYQVILSIISGRLFSDVTKQNRFSVLHCNVHKVSENKNWKWRWDFFFPSSPYIWYQVDVVSSLIYLLLEVDGLYALMWQHDAVSEFLCASHYLAV